MMADYWADRIVVMRVVKRVGSRAGYLDGCELG